MKLYVCMYVCMFPNISKNNAHTMQSTYIAVGAMLNYETTNNKEEDIDILLSNQSLCSQIHPIWYTSE